MSKSSIVIAVAAVAQAVLLSLHATAMLPLSWSEQEITGWQPASGHAFAAPLGTMWMSRREVGESPATVLENGVPLSCPNFGPEMIAEHGGGLFILANGQVYISAPDNSDPRSNGRRYTLRWPTRPLAFLPVSVVLGLSGLLALGGLAVLGYAWRSLLSRLLADPPLTLVILIFIVPFVAHRAWFFLDVPLPGVQTDTMTYYGSVQDLMAGRWPRFEIRPPGYPLLLAATLMSTRSLIAVTAIQTLLTLLSGVVLIYGVFKMKRSLAPWVAMAMAGYVTGFWPVQYDTSILSESLYTNGIVFAFGFLILALGTGSLAAFSASSAALAMVIATRPAGLFLVVPYALTVMFLLRNGRPFNQIVAFATPFIVLLLALSTYNLVRAGTFNVTAWGEANLAVATFTMWEPSAGYPSEVNDKILAVRESIGVTDAERRTMSESWSPKALAPIFLKGVSLTALDIASETGGDYVDARPWLRRISFDAIKRQPRTYAKYVATMAYMYYYDNIRWRADFGDYLQSRALGLLTDAGRAEQRTQPIKDELIASNFDATRSVGIGMRDGCAPADQVGAITATIWRRLYRLTQRIRDLVFGQVTFVIVFWAVLAAAAVRLVSSGGRHQGAFVLVVMGICVIGSGLIVCLVEYAGHRYSYPTEFIYYTVVAMAPLLSRANG